jgi:hypothetical protein
MAILTRGMLLVLLAAAGVARADDASMPDFGGGGDYGGFGGG